MSNSSDREYEKFVLSGDSVFIDSTLGVLAFPQDPESSASRDDLESKKFTADGKVRLVITA